MKSILKLPLAGCLRIAANYLFAQFKKVNHMQNNELKDKIIINIIKGMDHNMLSNTDLIDIIEEDIFITIRIHILKQM